MNFLVPQGAGIFFFEGVDAPTVEIGPMKTSEIPNTIETKH